MYIKYNSCDGVSVIEEKVDYIEIGKDSLICQRSKDNQYYDERYKEFEVELDSVHYISKEKRAEMMKTYKCIKEFVLPKCDDDGFEIDNEVVFIKEDSLWEIDESNSRLIGGEIRLESREEGYLDWMEICADTLKEHFEEIN